MLGVTPHISSTGGTVGAESSSEISALTSIFKAMSPDQTISPSKTIGKVGGEPGINQSINQRCDLMLSEQVTHLTDIQGVLEEVLDALEREDYSSRDKCLARAKALYEEAEHGSVLVSVIGKMQNELFHVRHDVQKLIASSDRSVLSRLQERAGWLETRIEQVLLLHRQSVLEGKRAKAASISSQSLGSGSSSDLGTSVKEDKIINTVNLGPLPFPEDSSTTREDTTTTTKSVKSHKSKATSTVTTRFTIPSTSKSEDMADSLWSCKKSGHQPLWHTLPLVPRSPIAISCLQFDRTVPWLDRKGSSYDLLREEYEELMVKVEKVYAHIQLIVDSSHEIDVNITSPTNVSSRMSRLADGKSADYDCYGLDPPLPLKWSRLSRNPANVYPRATRTWHKGVDLAPVRRIANQQQQQQASRQATPARADSIRVFSRARLRRARAKVLASVSLQRLNKNMAANRQADSLQSGLLAAQTDRLEFLINSSLQSEIAKVRKEAARDLGVLYKTQPSYTVINALKLTVYTDDNIFVLIEASKSLLNIGVWDTAALEIVLQAIKYGSQDLRGSLLDTLRSSSNPHLINKQSVQFRVLHGLLLNLIKKGSHTATRHHDNNTTRHHDNNTTRHHDNNTTREQQQHNTSLIMQDKTVNYNDKLASLAALVCAYFDIRDEAVRACLLFFLEEAEENMQSWALQALTKSLGCHSVLVIKCCLKQMKSAIKWENRAAAAKLIVLYKSSIEEQSLSQLVFDELQTLLYDDCSREVRQEVASAINTLGLHSKILQVVIRMLDDINEDVRAQGVMSLSILGIKGKSLLNQLLDILELDSSIYVRIQVMRAVKELDIGDRRVIRLLKERARGSGTMCKEAQLALYSLTGDIE